MERACPASPYPASENTQLDGALRTQMRLRAGQTYLGVHFREVVPLLRQVDDLEGKDNRRRELLPTMTCDL